MICPECGKEIHDEGAKFCSACGINLQQKTIVAVASRQLIRGYKLAVASSSLCCIYALLLPIVSCLVSAFSTPQLDSQWPRYDIHWYLYNGGCWQTFITLIIAFVNFIISARIYKFISRNGIKLKLTSESQKTLKQ